MAEQLPLQEKKSASKDISSAITLPIFPPQAQPIDLTALRAQAEQNLIYLTQHLTPRDDIYPLRHQKSLAISRVQRLLRQHQTIVEALRHQEQDPKQWQAFCHRAGQVLFDKGYYQPEAWLTSSLLPNADKTDNKQTRSNSDMLLDRILQDNRLWEYHQEITARLCEILLAAKVIRSGLVATASDTIDTAINAGAKVLEAGAKLVPVVGSAIGVGVKVMQFALSTANEISKQRDAAKLARWCVTPDEASLLAETLAFQLLPWRESVLAMGALAQNSLLQQAKDLYQQIKEAANLSNAQKLALQDIVVLSSLMKGITSTQSFSRTTRVNSNSAVLLDAFKKHEKIAVPEVKETTALLEKKEHPPTTTVVTPALPSTTYYWQEATRGLSATTVATSPLTKLQTASEQQVIADEKAWLCAKWQEQQYALEQPDLSRVLALQQTMLRGLAFPLNWTASEQQMALNQMQQLWAENLGSVYNSHR